MDARDLYGLPLDRFVPERNALAKALRKEGKREQATEVAAVRKPSLAAWAVNQLVRTQRAAVAELFEAGDALQEANSQLLAGRGDAKALRQALAREREAGSELSEKAKGLLGTAGAQLAPATLERVSETLHAAALDPEARTKVKDGCLDRELRHIGLHPAGPAGAPAAAQSRAKPDGSRERAKELSALRKAGADARRLAERAARELRSAQERRDRAADALREADEALAGARERAEQAALAHRHAQRELERATPSA